MNFVHYKDHTSVNINLVSCISAVGDNSDEIDPNNRSYGISFEFIGGTTSAIIWKFDSLKERDYVLKTILDNCSKDISNK